jgi:hypothetical protein
MKDRYEDDEDIVYIPPSKPRNPHVKEIYDGTHKGGKHIPKTGKFKPNYEAIVEEEELLLDEAEETQTDEEAERNWRDYLASQGL